MTTTAPAQPNATQTWYERNAARYDRRNPGIDGDAAFYAEHAAGRHVLEIGAGTGRVTEALARTAASVIGIDFSPAMLSRARRRLSTERGVNLLLADAGHLPFRNGYFDAAVLAYRTIQQLGAAEERQAVLCAVSGLVGSGGVCLLDTWHPPQAIERGRTDAEPALADITEAQIDEELRGAGFSVRHMWGGFRGERPAADSFVRVWVAERV